MSEKPEVRLVDANALLDAIPKNDELFSIDVRRAIVDAPTLDVEPVRHGRWIQSKTVYAYHNCSLCKVPHKMQMSCNVYVLLKYCPHCGAKMDDENAHEV